MQFARGVLALADALEAAEAVAEARAVDRDRWFSEYTKEHARVKAAEAELRKVRYTEAAVEAQEERAERYQRRVVAHHELGTLSHEVLVEWDGGPCPVCERADTA